MTFTSGTGNGYVKGVHTGSTFDTGGNAMDAIVSSIEAIGSKTVSGVSQTVSTVSCVSTESSQTIAVAVVAKAVMVGIKDSGVSLSLSLGIGSSQKGSDNCNKGLHVFIVEREAPLM